MGRTLRTLLALVATATLTLGACGGDDGDDPPGTTATTADDEGAATEVPEDDGDGEGDPCGALQEVADVTAEIDAASEGAWTDTQAAYAELGPAIVDAYDRAASAVDDDTAAADLTLLRDLLDQTVDIVASSSTVEEFAARVSALPGAQDGETAADRLDGYSNTECGFALS